MQGQPSSSLPVLVEVPVHLPDEERTEVVYDWNGDLLVRFVSLFTYLFLKLDN